MHKPCNMVWSQVMKQIERGDRLDGGKSWKYVEKK